VEVILWHILNILVVPREVLGAMVTVQDSMIFLLFNVLKGWLTYCTPPILLMTWISSKI
jgi:hypothetical protein